MYISSHQFTAGPVVLTGMGLLMDDSILQGGFFNHDWTEHVIDRDLLNRTFVQFEYRIVASYKLISVSVGPRLITSQYQHAPSQQVGSLTLFVGS